MQAQQPEQALLAWGELLVGDGERRGHAAVGGGQLGQALPLVTQAPGKMADGPGRAGGQPGGADPDGQRQVPAQPQHLMSRARFRGSPAGAGDGREQGQRIIGRQGVERQHARGV